MGNKELFGLIAAVAACVAGDALGAAWGDVASDSRWIEAIAAQYARRRYPGNHPVSGDKKAARQIRAASSLLILKWGGAPAQS